MAAPAAVARVVASLSLPLSASSPTASGFGGFLRPAEWPPEAPVTTSASSNLFRDIMQNDERQIAKADGISPFQPPCSPSRRHDLEHWHGVT
jgi:hypothetical protein